MIGWKTLTILLCSLCLYNIFGAVVFHFLERPKESSLQTTETARFTNFISTYTCVNATVMEQFVVDLIAAYDSGVLSAGNTTSASSWDMASSLFFSFTVLTTIGGRLFCVFFALLGIPAMGVSLVSIGQRLNSLYKRMEGLRICCANKTVDRLVKYLGFHVLMVCLLMFLPSLLFTLVEGWEYGTSLYYCFISLTTIGFGDYVAGQTEVYLRVLYRLIIILWLMLGLAWISLMISSMQDIVTSITEKVDNLEHDPEKAQDAATTGDKAAEDEKKKEEEEKKKKKKEEEASPRAAAAAVCVLPSPAVN